MKKTNAALLAEIGKLEGEMLFWKNAREELSRRCSYLEERVGAQANEIRFLRQIVENLSRIEVMSRS